MADYDPNAGTDISNGGGWGSMPDVITKADLPPAGGQVFTTPGYVQPPPGPNASAPRPSVNPSVVYTDAQGNGYDAPALAAAWNNGSLAGGPNARVPDILAQNGIGGAPAKAAAGGSGGGNPGTGVFTDPASQAWEAALNARIGQLQTPYNNPGFQPAIDQLTQYLQKLNGPAYTPDQMGVMQTQALDPLEHQRTAAKQQIVQRMASHGIGPGSGILEKALEDADQQFSQLRTKTQAGFATNAIGQSNQNAGIAAQVAPLIAQMYQGQFNAQDQRNQMATQLAGTVPMAAWERLMGANGMMQQQNPLSALQLLGGFQQTGYNQGADFGSGLMQLLQLLMQ